MGKFDFKATTISCYTESDVLIVGMGDDEHDPDNYVILSRLDEDGQTIDEGIGLQTSWLDYEFPNAISSVVVDNEHVDIAINNEHVDEIGYTDISIALSAPKFDFDLLIQYLTNIFEGSSVQLLINGKKVE